MPGALTLAVNFLRSLLSSCGCEIGNFIIQLWCSCFVIYLVFEKDFGSLRSEQSK